MATISRPESRGVYVIPEELLQLGLMLEASNAHEIVFQKYKQSWKRICTAFKSFFLNMY